MRKGMTLIELILAIVIIAIVFTVIPRIIAVSNRSSQLSIKEDGLYNAMLLTGHIMSISWDKNTIDTDGKILDAGGVPCAEDTNHPGKRRQGAFLGTMRLCSDVAPDDTAQSDMADVDDYNGYDRNSTGGRIIYRMQVSVTRDKDVKDINTTVSTTDKRVGRAFQRSVIYKSYNLGQVQIPSRAVE